MKASPYTLVNGYLYKLGLEDIHCQCTFEHERQDSIEETHLRPIAGHFHADKTTIKILQYRIWWPSLHKGYKEYVNKWENVKEWAKH